MWVTRPSGLVGLAGPQVDDGEVVGGLTGVGHNTIEASAHDLALGEKRRGESSRNRVYDHRWVQVRWHSMLASRCARERGGRWLQRPSCSVCPVACALGPSVEADGDRWERRGVSFTLDRSRPRGMVNETEGFHHPLLRPAHCALSIHKGP
nr:hypothetical protein CFP56_78957 [Quercus suber]